MSSDERVHQVCIVTRWLISLSESLGAYFQVQKEDNKYFQARFCGHPSDSHLYSLQNAQKHCCSKSFFGGLWFANKAGHQTQTLLSGSVFHPSIQDYLRRCTVYLKFWKCTNKYTVKRWYGKGIASRDGLPWTFWSGWISVTSSPQARHSLLTEIQFRQKLCSQLVWTQSKKSALHLQSSFKCTNWSYLWEEEGLLDMPCSSICTSLPLLWKSHTKCLDFSAWTTISPIYFCFGNLHFCKQVYSPALSCLWWPPLRVMIKTGEDTSLVCHQLTCQSSSPLTFSPLATRWIIVARCCIDHDGHFIPSEIDKRIFLPWDCSSSVACQTEGLLHMRVDKHCRLMWVESVPRAMQWGHCRSASLFRSKAERAYSLCRFAIP